MPTSAACFWSYTHRDNELERDRILRLAAAISDAYELMTSEELDLFIDRRNVAWGNEWRATIDNALERTAFFIPVVTPLFLRSEECRREFVEFSSRSAAAGSPELLLPILYVDTPDVWDDNTTDEVSRLIRATQYIDWRELRLAPEDSSEYRRGVNQAASRLMELIESLADTPLAIPEPVGDDEPGLLDLIAQAEDNVETWQGTLEDLAIETATLTEILVSATDQLRASDRRGAGARGRLVVLRAFGQDVNEPAENIHTLGNQFLQSVIASDPGVQAIIEQMQVSESDSSDERGSFLRSIAGLATSAGGMANAIRPLVSQLDQSRSMSRDIRAPIAKIRSGLTAILDAETILKSWERMATEAG